MEPGVTVIPRIPVADLPSVYLCLTVLTEGNIQADSLLALIDIYLAYILTAMKPFYSRPD